MQWTWANQSNFCLLLYAVIMTFRTDCAKPDKEDSSNDIQHGQMDSRTMADKPMGKKINNKCQYPCKCSNKETQCQAGVDVIKDGCECCYMCARQQGDLCDDEKKCDEAKGLFCYRAFEGDSRGICRAKKAESCTFGGRIYKDGEEFQPDCRRLCTCQNGQYACASLCPNEDRRPSMRYCPNARLVTVGEQCCKEWVCPLQQDDTQNEDNGNAVIGGGGVPSGGMNSGCKKETTPWSSCSVTCDIGISVRNTNDNEDCIPVQQTRLCLVRPCQLRDNHLLKQGCKSTWKARATEIEYGNCRSTLEYKLKYCSTCKKKKCCGPGRTKTVTIEFTCDDGSTRIEPFMWIKNCDCHNKHICPWK